MSRLTQCQCCIPNIFSPFQPIRYGYIQTLSSATFEKFESKFYAKPDMPKQRVKPGDNVPETQEH